MADIPLWPAVLPAPSPDGYSLTPVSVFSRTDMDNGTARQRRRFTRTPSYIAVSWMLTQEQFAVFEGFLEYEIGLGTNWFQTRLLNGLGMTPVQARFKDDPPYTAATQGSTGLIIQVTASLEVKALPVVTANQYAVIKLYTEDEIADMSDPLHEIIHVELPGPSRWN